MKKFLSFALITFTGCLAAVDDPSQREGAGGTTTVVTASGGSNVAGPVGTGGRVTGGTVVNGTGGSGSGTGSGGRVGTGTGGSSTPDAGAGTDAQPPTPDAGAPDARPIGTGGAAGTRAGSGGVTSSGGATGTGGGPATGTGGRPAGTGGGPVGTGGAGTGGATTAVVCTSNVMWNGSTGPNMRPGISCRGCHGYPVAGTVYPTLHEPTNCNGVNGSAGVRVIITGADGSALTLTPNAAGNFFSNTSPSTPFTVRITSNAGTRMMTTPQTSGDCNSCHTQNGSNGAPGRIMAP